MLQSKIIRASYPFLFALFPVRNELERQFLELLQFNINVPSSVYAKYYFDLRALAEANELAFPTEPLNKERAVKLEALSSVIEDKFRDIHKVTLITASLNALRE